MVALDFRNLYLFVFNRFLASYIVLDAELDDSQTFLSTLWGIALERNQDCTVKITRNELRFIWSDPSMSLQAVACVHRRIFDIWKCDELELMTDADERCIDFKLNLSLLIKCVGNLSYTSGLSSIPSQEVQTDMKISYDSLGGCLNVHLLDGEVLTECKVRTIDFLADDSNMSKKNNKKPVDDISENDDFAWKSVSQNEVQEEPSREPEINFSLAFDSQQVINEVTVKSEYMKEVFAEITEFSESSSMTVVMQPQAPYFELQCSTVEEKVSFGLSSTDPDVTTANCSKRLIYSYRMSLFQYIGIPLNSSDEITIKMNNEGGLVFSYKFLQANEKVTKVEYYILPENEISS